MRPHSSGWTVAENPERPERRPGLTAWGGALNGKSCSYLAVAVGFEPTVDFHPHTLSSSGNQRSGTVVGVRLVLTKTGRDVP